ncbi:hypothetical protein [Pontibacter liquoris]|uniref:hypothetical protein n=1 Tax=Pontibacter liquoris TaxID=2905677 RepID=UPI001FA6D12C|nr:hypothetical protein [Pontibacter liquoris]
MENKHEIEEYFFQKLNELYPKLPKGKVSKPEPPDFVIDTGTETVAIEITQIYNEKEANEKFPPAQKYATEDSIVEEAKRLFYLRSKIPLHVSFSFASNVLLNENQKRSLSNWICQFVEAEAQKRELDKHFSFTYREELPQELIRVSGYYFPNVTGTSWFAIKSRLVPNLTKREVLNIISRKEKKLNQYSNKVDKTILVIAEGLIPNSWYDSIETFGNSELKSEFDKIFIIRYLSNQLIELK